MEVNEVYSALITINSTLIIFLLTATLAYYTFIKNRINSIEIEIGDNIYEFIEKCGIDVSIDAENYNPEYCISGKNYTSFNSLVKEVCEDIYFEKEQVSNTQTNLINKKPDYDKIRIIYRELMLNSRTHLIEITILKRKDAETIHREINNDIRTKINKIINNCKNFNLPFLQFNIISFLNKISEDIEETNKENNEKITKQTSILNQYNAIKDSVEKNLKTAERGFKKLDKINDDQIEYSMVKKITQYEFFFGILLPLVLINGFPKNILFWGFYDISILISWIVIFLSLCPYAFLMFNVHYLFVKSKT